MEWFGVKWNIESLMSTLIVGFQKTYWSYVLWNPMVSFNVSLCKTAALVKILISKEYPKVVERKY